MTAEITHVDTSDAERRALKISLRLDSIADNFEAVMPMIREALELGDHLALGYRSPGEYLSTRFGNALERLPLVMRREAVRELTAAGLSTRAIAPVVGTSHMAVKRDLDAGVTQRYTSPEPDYVTDEADLMVNRETGEITEAPASPPITGIDGKTYARSSPGRSTPRRQPLPEDARTAGWALRTAVERIQAIGQDDRFATHKEAVAPHLRSHLTNAIEVCQDLLSRIDN